MNKICKLLIIIILLIFSSVSLYYYFFNKITYKLTADELSCSRIITIISLNLFFYVLIFLLDINYYKQILTYILIFVASVWILVIYFNLASISHHFWNYWEIIVYITFSMISPGIIVYIIHYIKKSTSRLEESKIFGIYHLHEGFIGIVLIILAFVFLVIQSALLFLAHPFFRKYSIFLLFTQIFSFVFLYLGSFFIFRDWNDVIRFKFIEKKKISRGNNKINQSVVFNQITLDDLHFFEFPKIITYPIGMLLTIFSLSAIIYGTDFLPEKIFNLENEFIIQLGYLLSFIAGGLLGRDWFRIFRRFYPELYKEIENIISNLKNNIK